MGDTAGDGGADGDVQRRLRRVEEGVPGLRHSVPHRALPAARRVEARPRPPLLLPQPGPPLVRDPQEPGLPPGAGEGLEDEASPVCKVLPNTTPTKQSTYENAPPRYISVDTTASH